MRVTEMEETRQNCALKVRAVLATDLTSDLITKWAQLADENADLGSPFFAPEFTMAVGSVVPNVYVGIMESNGEPIAFLPFRRTRLGIGKRLRPSDYQGLIAKPGVHIDVAHLVRECGLRSYDFDKLPAAQELFKPFCHQFSESPILDMSGGFEAYLAERRSHEKDQFKAWTRRTRKLEAEVGPLLFEPNVRSPEMFRESLAWKFAKYQKTREYSLMESTLLKLFATQEPRFKGTLSVLYAGTNVVAAQFSLRSRNTCHCLVPGYNPKFEKYSAGVILLLKMAEVAPQLGITVIDLGIGPEDYKKRLMNGVIPLAGGSVEISPLLSLMRTLQKNAKKCLHQMPVLHSLTRRLFRFQGGSSHGRL